jgi:hypothetical protein
MPRLARTSLAALTAVSLLGLTGCGSPDLKTADGRSVKDVDKFLKAATTTWQQTLDAATANTAKGAACFAGTADDTITGAIFCGPVLHQFGDTAKPWDSYEVTASGGGDEATLTVSEDGPSKGEALPAGVTLVNPDAKVPSTDGLAVPPPPVMDDPSAVQTVDSSVPITGGKAPEDGRLRTPYYGLTVDRVASPALIGTGSDQRRAPNGQQLYVVSFTTDPTDTTDADMPSRRLTLVTGDTRRDLAGVIGDTEATSDEPITIAFAAAQGQPVALELSDSTLTQTFDLVGLKRTGEAPDVLYRAAKYPLQADVNIARTVTYKRYRGDGSVDNSVMDSKQITGKFEVSVDKLALVYREGDVQAKSTDRALLSVAGGLTFRDSSGEGGWGMTNTALTNISLTLPDKTVIHPQRVKEEDGFFGGTLVFDVPATFTTGTITITPGRIRSSANFVGGVIWATSGTYSYPISIR